MKILLFLCLPVLVFSQKNITNTTEMGFLLGSAGTNDVEFARASPTVSSFTGYKVLPKLAVGLTVGLDWYKAQMMLPISVGIRGVVSKQKKVTPTYGLDVGKGMMWLNRKASVSTRFGGLHFCPVVGLRIPVGSQAALTWSVGYKYQFVETRTDGSFGESVTRTYNYKRAVFRMGMSF